MAYYEFYKVSKRPTNDNAKMALAQQNYPSHRVAGGPGVSGDVDGASGSNTAPNHPMSDKPT
jgi:hypothetical protein